MSEKERNKFDWTWNALARLNENKGRDATAGELARAMGISRNTAKKYLTELIRTGTICAVDCIGKNHQSMTCYKAINQANW